MTKAFSLTALLEQLSPKWGVVVSVKEDCLYVKAEKLLEIADYLKSDPNLDFNYLNAITGIDYKTHFELIYRLESLKHNHYLTLKVECPKTTTAIPSIAQIWAGANFQEREIFDLFGISFVGHPDLKRIVLWDGFEGYPLRKDFKHAT
jgi:NADH-quinone oxidoreductase subunit C